MTEDITMDNGDFLHNYSKVTRIEVIGKERDLVRYGCEDVQVSLQDDGQTLKVFYGWDSEDEAALVELVKERLAEGGPTTQVTIEELSNWSSEDETRYLASIPGMRESILEGMATPSEELAGKEALEW